MADIRDFVKISIPSMMGNDKNVNLRALKKSIEEKMNEKVKIYGFIGMETYDLIKENKVEIPQLNGYIEKMEELDKSIQEMEDQIKQEELKNKGKNVCACGFRLKPQDKFCPNCGEAVLRDSVICTCGAEVKRDAKFCGSCGRSLEEILNTQNEAPKLAMKECICGAKVPAGQFMCLECGRKIE